MTTDAVARAFRLAAIRLSLLFAVAFYGVDAITAGRAVKHRIGFAFESAIAYWPPAYAVYFSVIGAPFLVRWLAPDAAHVRQWELRMAAAIVAAAFVFLLLPAQLGYPPADAGAWSAVARLAPWIAGTHNLLPSLHVGLMLVIAICVWPHASPAVRAAIAAWALALAASTLLTHQHHVLDLLAGAVLGVVAGLARVPRD